MGIDTPSGGDNSPDRGSEGGDKPFPGAPANRESVGPPKTARTLEDVNDALDRSSNYTEFEAIAKETEPAELYGPRSSEPGSSDAGSAASGSAAVDSGPGVTEAAGDEAGTVSGAQGEDASVPGADVSGDRQPEGTPQDDGFARPETFLRPDSELPPFPGASANREPVEEPTRSRTMDDVNAALDRSSNYLEFEAIAKETDPYAKEASAARPGDSTPARDVSSGEAAAEESGEQQGEGTDGEASEETAPEQSAVRMPQQEMPAAEAPEGEHAPLDGGRTDTVVDGQEAVRHEGPVVLDQGDEGTEAEPAPEGIEPAKDGVVATRSDATAPEADDRPVVEGIVEPGRPEAGPDERDAGDTNATRSEVRLDSQSDDQRPVTRAEMMAMVAELEAKHRAEVDAIKAEHQQETAESNAKLDEMSTANQELKQKADDLEGKLDTILQHLQGSSDRGSEGDEQASLQEGTQADEGQTTSSPENQPDSARPVEQHSPTDAPISPDVSERRREDVATADRMEPEHPQRKWFTIDNASAVGSVAGFGASIAAIFSQVPPEIAAGPAAIGAFAGIMGSTIIKRLRNKQRG